MLHSHASKHLLVLKQLLGVAHILLASNHPAINYVNASEQIGCRAPLLRDYSSVSKCLLARECDIALGRYHSSMVYPHVLTKQFQSSS